MRLSLEAVESCVVWVLDWMLYSVIFLVELLAVILLVIGIAKAIAYGMFIMGAVGV